MKKHKKTKSRQKQEGAKAKDEEPEESGDEDNEPLRAIPQSVAAAMTPLKRPAASTSEGSAQKRPAAKGKGKDEQPAAKGNGKGGKQPAAKGNGKGGKQPAAKGQGKLGKQPAAKGKGKDGPAAKGVMKRPAAKGKGKGDEEQPEVDEAEPEEAEEDVAGPDSAEDDDPEGEEQEQLEAEEDGAPEDEEAEEVEGQEEPEAQEAEEAEEPEEAEEVDPDELEYADDGPVDQAEEVARSTVLTGDTGWIEFANASDSVPYQVKLMSRASEGYYTIQYRKVQWPPARWKQLVQTNARDHRITDEIIQKLEVTEPKDVAKWVIERTLVAVVGAKAADKAEAETHRDRVWAALLA